MPSPTCSRSTASRPSMFRARGRRSASERRKICGPALPRARSARARTRPPGNAARMGLARWSGMTSQTELLRFGLAALLTGVAIPLAVQLFLVMRNVQRVTATLDRRLDQTLRDVADVVAELKRVTVPA